MTHTYTYTAPEAELGDDADAHFLSVLNSFTSFSLKVFEAEGMPISTTMANVAAGALAGLIANDYKDLVLHILTSFAAQLAKGEVDGEHFVIDTENTVNSNERQGEDQ